MNDRKEKYFLNFSIILILAAAFGVAYVLFLLPEDISLGGKEERYIFGATYMTMNNPFYQTVDSQMRADIEKNGDVLLTRDAAMNQDRQNEEIRELINSGAEVIFLTPVEWDHASEGIEAARAAGVKIIVVDTFVSNPESVTCSVVSDNYQAGVLCAEHLLSVRDEAKIILLEHITARSGTERIRGFTDTIAGHDGFEVVGSGESDGQIENAMPVMEELLRKYPDADTVMALNDPSAFGAMAAIEGAGLSDRFLVYSVDGSPEAKTLINDGMMTASCAQFPNVMADEAVSAAYRSLKGLEVEKEIIINVKLITEKNVSEYGTFGWQ